MGLQLIGDGIGGVDVGKENAVCSFLAHTVVLGDFQHTCVVRHGNGHGVDRGIVGNVAVHIAVFGSCAVGQLLLDGIGVGSDIISSKGQGIKCEGAVCIDLGFADLRTALIIQIEGERVSSQGLFALQHLGAFDQHRGIVGPVNILECDRRVFRIGIAGVLDSGSGAHLTVAAVSDLHSHMVLAGIVVDTCCPLLRDHFLQDEVMVTHAQSSQLKGDVSVRIVGDLVGDQGVLGKVCIGFIDRVGKFSGGQVTACQSLDAGQGNRNRVGTVGVNKCDVLRTVAGRSSGYGAVAVVGNLYSHGKLSRIVGNACGCAGNFFDRVGVDAHIVHVIGNGIKSKAAVCQVGGGGDLCTGAVIQTEGEHAGGQFLPAAVDLQGLHALDHQLGRLRGIGVGKYRCLLGGIFKVVNCCQGAVAGIGDLYHQMIDIAVIGHTAQAAVDLHHIVIVSADLAEDHIACKQHIAVGIIGAHSHSAFRGGMTCLAVGEDSEGKFSRLEITALQVLCHGRHDVQVHTGILRIIGISKGDLCTVAVYRLTVDDQGGSQLTGFCILGDHRFDLIDYTGIGPALCITGLFADNVVVAAGGLVYIGHVGIAAAVGEDGEASAALLHRPVAFAVYFGSLCNKFKASLGGQRIVGGILHLLYDVDADRSSMEGIDKGDLIAAVGDSHIVQIRYCSGQLTVYVCDRHSEGPQGTVIGNIFHRADLLADLVSVGTGFGKGHALQHIFNGEVLDAAAFAFRITQRGSLVLHSRPALAVPLLHHKGKGTGMLRLQQTLDLKVLGARNIQIHNS